MRSRDGRPRNSLHASSRVDSLSVFPRRPGRRSVDVAARFPQPQIRLPLAIAACAAIGTCLHLAGRSPPVTATT